MRRHASAGTGKHHRRQQGDEGHGRDRGPASAGTRRRKARQRRQRRPAPPPVSRLRLDADLGRQHAEQPERRAAARRSPARASAQTIQGPGRGRAGQRGRAGGHQQIGGAEPEAERQEDDEDLRRPPASAKPTRGGEERRGAGGGEQGRQGAGEEIAQQPVLAVGGARPGARRNPAAAPRTSPRDCRRSTVSSRAMAARNSGCWNWKPQPTASPAALQARRPGRQRGGSSPARRRRWRGSSGARARVGVSPWPTKASSFSDSTGSTQGMRLRMSPPSRAASSAGSRAEPPIAGAGTALASRPRVPSATVSSSGVPASSGALGVALDVDGEARRRARRLEGDFRGGKIEPGRALDDEIGATSGKAESHRDDEARIRLLALAHGWRRGAGHGRCRRPAPGSDSGR